MPFPTPIRFEPEPGTDPSMGIGNVLYDDGSSRYTPGDPELAQLLAVYQDSPEIPQFSSPAEMRGSGALGADQRTAALSAATPGAGAVVDALNTQGANMPPLPSATLPPDIPPPAPSAPAPSPQPVRAAVTPQAASGVPPTPTAGDMFRVAAAEELQPKYVPGQAAGYQPAQRSGALPEDIASRQQSELTQADSEVMTQTELAREAEIEMQRNEAAMVQARAAGQRADAEQAAREAQARKARFEAERRDVENMQINADLRHEGPLKGVLTVLGSALMGFVGSDAGLRMAEKRIDTHVRTQLEQRGSKLRRLADAIGSEDQAIAHAKERYYGALQTQLDADIKKNRAQFAGKQTGVVLAALRRQQLAAAHEAETQSLGKTTEVYQQGRAGGYAPGSMLKAAEIARKGEQSDADRAKAAQIGKPKPEQQKNINALKRIVDVLERGAKNGAAQSVVGWQNKKLGLGITSPNDVQRATGTMPPEQLEVLTAIEELEVNNLMRLVREPNNVKTQNMVQKIGSPQSDRELPVTIARLKELIAEEEGTAGSDIPAPIEEK